MRRRAGNKIKINFQSLQQIDLVLINFQPHDFALLMVVPEFAIILGMNIQKNINK